MITIEYAGKRFTTTDVYEAEAIIKEARYRGYHPTWSCDDPEDNEYLWEWAN